MKGKFELSPQRRGQPGREEAEALAAAALGFIAADDERLGRFIAATGLDPTQLRRAAAEPGFLAGILDHLVGDEALLVACADHLGIPPERLAAAWHRLSPQDSG